MTTDHTCRWETLPSTGPYWRREVLKARGRYRLRPMGRSPPWSPNEYAQRLKQTETSCLQGQNVSYGWKTPCESSRYLTENRYHIPPATSSPLLRNTAHHQYLIAKLYQSGGQLTQHANINRQRPLPFTPPTICYCTDYRCGQRQPVWHFIAKVRAYLSNRRVEFILLADVAASLVKKQRLRWYFVWHTRLSYFLFIVDGTSLHLAEKKGRVSIIRRIRGVVNNALSAEKKQQPSERGLLVLLAIQPFRLLRHHRLWLTHDQLIWWQVRALSHNNWGHSERWMVYVTLSRGCGVVVASCETCVTVTQTYKASQS